ncbi:putative indole-3-pyruvate monooxygenase YUCCA1 [Lachnellula arida]|uniref:Putative indole-3-pyruvate monooxygenase YUCCA1 n=1 Tax=Lachnellula arida TaxID=1316785 RepID=A0A8T9BE71_9HELO|nr:putative indole-3-pyruvate monooxygenase YUCCA1 [Lachnellula arida]
MGDITPQTQVELPSSERCEPGSFPLAIAEVPEISPANAIDAHTVASKWISSINKTLNTSDFGEIPNLFLAGSYWRDQLCLSWNFHTLHGPEKIASILKDSKTGSRIKWLDLDTSSALRSPTAKLNDEGKVVEVQAFLTVVTDVGSGAGIVKLVPQKGTWKAFTLFTFLKGIKGHEELVGKKRPVGVEHGEHTSQKNWLDQRVDEGAFGEGDEPTVLILGAGQAGLTIAARLKMLGVKSLIIDRELNIGDNWRTRYHQLVLHDPIWFDHLPYLSFPETWPIFTPKDKLGDWFESYVKLLELNAWTQTSIKGSSWDDSTASWTVEVERIDNGKTTTRTLHPKHVIQATGASGEANIPDIKGLSTFKGDRIVHSSKYTAAKPSHGKNKRAIIVGCCNSGHDIAQNYHENGYAVTMVQRSSTFVVSAEMNVAGLIPLYCEGSPPTEDSDIMNFGVPNPVVKKAGIDATIVQQEELDRELLEGLEKAGFNLDRGPDGAGLWIKYLQKGGGYYIDVGCSQLIIDGKIKVKQGQEIAEILPNGIKFADDEILEADEIVLATGYLNMRTQCRRIFGSEVADRVKDVWGFDEEGETRTLWRKSGHPGFWFMAGNLALCRFYSRPLALQIKGLVEGIYKYDDL